MNERLPSEPDNVKDKFRLKASDLEAREPLAGVAASARWFETITVAQLFSEETSAPGDLGAMLAYYSKDMATPTALATSSPDAKVAAALRAHFAPHLSGSDAAETILEGLAATAWEPELALPPCISKNMNGRRSDLRDLLAYATAPEGPDAAAVVAKRLRHILGSERLPTLNAICVARVAAAAAAGVVAAPTTKTSAAELLSIVIDAASRMDVKLCDTSIS